MKAMDAPESLGRKMGGFGAGVGRALAEKAVVFSFVGSAARISFLISTTRGNRHRRGAGCQRSKLRAAADDRMDEAVKAGGAILGAPPTRRCDTRATADPRSACWRPYCPNCRAVTELFA
jgi:hypothetical protein